MIKYGIWFEVLIFFLTENEIVYLLVISVLLSVSQTKYVLL